MRYKSTPYFGNELRQWRYLAGLVVEADILTELAVAHPAVGALAVGGAADGLPDAAHHGGGVGDVGGGAGALGPVVHHLAVGVRATGVQSAGVSTPEH